MSVTGPHCAASRGPCSERRAAPDRRTRTLRSLATSSFRRRRHGPRRLGDGSLAVTDWYAPQWLAAALLILLLCVTDALLTLALLGHGAREANPVMNAVVHGDARIFAGIKFGLTAAGVVVLILLARVRAFGRLPVSALLYGVLAGYLCLVVYEFSMLRVLVPEYF